MLPARARQPVPAAKAIVLAVIPASVAGSRREQRRSPRRQSDVAPAFEDIVLHPLSTTEEYEAMLEQSQAGTVAICSYCASGPSRRP